MAPGLENPRITIDSIREEREAAAERERQANLRNLSRHTLPALDGQELDKVLREQAGVRNDLARDVIATIRPEEISAKVREETVGKATKSIRSIEGLDPGAAREQVGASAREMTPKVTRSLGLQAHETDAVAAGVAELAANAAVGRAASEEYMGSTEVPDSNIAGRIVPGRDDLEAPGPRGGRQPETRGGKGLELSKYSPRGRVYRGQAA